MKSSPLTTILMVLVAFAAVASVGFCFFYIKSFRELSQLQTQEAVVVNTRAAINSLANELLEYSKTHRDIDPILEAARVKAPSQPQAPAKNPK